MLMWLLLRSVVGAMTLCAVTMHVSLSPTRSGMRICARVSPGLATVATCHW